MIITLIKIQRIYTSFANINISMHPHTPPPLVLCQVKMWVQLLIPRIEDGNNFGVSIQVSTHPGFNR